MKNVATISPVASI